MSADLGSRMRRSGNSGHPAARGPTRAVRILVPLLFCVLAGSALAGE
jgi:hypothetical protein